MINRVQFYTIFKRPENFGRFTTSQYNGFEAIFDEWDAQGLTDNRWLAYILATVWHETDKKMHPIEEYGKGKGRPYGKKIKYSGQPYSVPNKLYYGRGHTQNTWFEIYEKLTKANKNGWDFLNHPELLLQMKPSIWVTFHAMQTGLYTGKKLSHYFNKDSNTQIGARRIINGTDKADLIASYHRKFLSALI